MRSIERKALMAASSMRVLAHRVFDDLQSINDSNDPKTTNLQQQIMMQN